MQVLTYLLHEYCQLHWLCRAGGDSTYLLTYVLGFRTRGLTTAPTIVLRAGIWWQLQCHAVVVVVVVVPPGASLAASRSEGFKEGCSQCEWGRTG